MGSLLVALALAGAARAATPPRSLRVVSYNLLHGGIFSGWWGRDRLDDRLATATAALRELDADVIGVQEASRGAGRGDVAARLARALGFHHVFVPVEYAGMSWLGRFASALARFDEGPAVLSRFPIRRWQAHTVRACGEYYSRVLLCAELDTPWGPLDACSTHVSGSLCQAKSLSGLLDAERRAPLILTGDLNATERSPELRLLLQRAGLIDTFRRANPEDPGLTVWQWIHTASRMARRRVDYILFRPTDGHTGQVLESRVVLDTPRRDGSGDVLWPSDHYGVLSEIEVFPPS